MPSSDAVHDLTSLLKVLQDKVDSDGDTGGAEKTISLRDVLELIGRRAYGPLLLVLGLISISPATIIPGANWAVATLTLLISVQMALHRDTPWLPSSALRMRISERALGKFTRGAAPTAKAIDKLLRPRLKFLSDQPWITGVAFLCILASLVTFPLALIPLGPIAPGLAITFFGLGVTARDGLLLLAGGVVMALGAWVAVGGFL